MEILIFKGDGTPNGRYNVLERELVEGMDLVEGTGRGTTSTTSSRELQNVMYPPYRNVHSFENVSDVLPVTSPNRLDASASKLTGLDPEKGSTLDYVFFVKEGGHGENQVRLVTNASRVEQMLVQNEEFVSRSDHFGISLEVVCDAVEE